MKILINDENLRYNDISEFREKARAILFDEQNNILVANYGGTLMLPGGSLIDREQPYETLIRELKEETGIDYEVTELEYYNSVEHYQKNYKKRNGEIKNRLIRTHYFMGSYKGVNASFQNLSESEKKADFRLELLPLDMIEERILTSDDTNPRKESFDRELLALLKSFNKPYQYKK